MKRTLLLLCGASLLFAGCGGKTMVKPNGVGTIEGMGKPEWISKDLSEGGVFGGKSGTVIYSSGMANATANRVLQRETADQRARASIASILKTNVGKLFKDFMEEHKDYFDIDNSAGSDELTQSVIKSVADATLFNCRIVDRWEDPVTGVLYSLARIDLNDNLYDNYQKSVQRALHREVVKERMDEALKSLDTEIDKQRAREKEILDVTEPPPVPDNIEPPAMNP